MSIAPVMESRPEPDAAMVIEDLLRENRYQEALGFYFSLPERARSHPFMQGGAATAAARLGQFAPAAILAKAAEAGFEKSGRASDRVRMSNLLGALALEQGDLVAAEARFRDLIKRRDQLVEERIIVAHAITNLASIMDLRGLSDAALRMYHEALREYQEQLDSRGMAQTYHNINMVFRKLSMMEAAESVARMAVRNAEQDGEPSLIALCLVGQAETRLERKDYDGASQCLVRALSQVSDNTDQLVRAEIGRVMAQLHLARGKIREALVEAEISRSIANRCGCALVAAECSAVAAIGFTLDGKMVEAEHRKDEAKRRFQQLETTWLLEHYTRAWNEACLTGTKTPE
jgi:tetratricopeptide (TPR) repeat protein